MKKTLTAIGILFVVLISSGCVTTDPQENSIPNTTLTDYQGNELQLHQYIGTPLVINSWATWCPFCKDELPLFADIQQEYGTEINVIIIDRRESLETAKKETDKLQVTKRLTPLLDPKDQFYTDIGGFTMPETLFVDKDGIIKMHKRGPITKSEIMQHIKLITDN